MKKLEIRALPNPDYFVQSEIDRLRVNVGFSGSDKRVIMVTSSLPNEGKSYIAANLWLGLAKAGNKVCLVDMDMRKSDLRNTLRLSNTDNEQFIGLSHLLAGKAQTNDVVYATNVENAFIVPTLTLINPSLLLDGEMLDSFLNVLRKSFDYIIIDTPPLGVVSDGQLIASKVDGAILVVRAHETSKTVVKSSMQQIAKVNCTLIGVVLNRVLNKRTKGYYTKSYYSQYYAKDESASK